MKRVLSIILAAVLLLLTAGGCGQAQNTSSATQTSSAAAGSQQAAYEPADIRIGGLTGSTSMGMVRLMESAEAGTAANRYTFTIAGSADELTPKLVQGALDVVAVPANLASVLYNNTDKSVTLLAINTLGVLYIVENGITIQSLKDLKSKTIYATGKGSMPEYTLRYLLSENGVDPNADVTIEWKTEPAEVVALMKEAQGSVAMLPQPYVTIAQSQMETLRVAVDLTQAWDALQNGSTLVTGVLIVRNEFAKQYPDQIKAFLEEYKQSAEYVNANIPEAAQLIEKFGIFKAAVAQKALPYCNITYLAGAQMKTVMQGYLDVLFKQNPKSVGGSLPGDDFYYEG